WWYTQDSFVYRLFNKALRKKNLSLLLLFRFLINDIESELDKHRCLTSIRVYRSQWMSKKEFELLKDSIGQLMSVNSFLWTNLIRKSALSNLKEFSGIDPNLQGVLFEIDIDVKCHSRKAFANITSFSYFKGEQEILFMLGTIFRIINIQSDPNQIGIIQLLLCNDNQHELKSIDHFQNRDELDPLAFGHL
ncbi:hypothetical protein DMUE_6384, partial [Dictyocoela muelleri]